MSDITWKDASSYSQGDKARIPNHLEARAGRVRISVHRHIHYSGEWLLSCRGLDVDMHVLKAKELEPAKQEACRIVWAKLTDEVYEIQKAIKILEGAV